MQKEKSLSTLIRNVNIKPTPRQSMEFRQSLTKTQKNNIHTSVIQSSMNDNLSLVRSAENLFKKQKARTSSQLPPNMQNKNPNFIKTIHNQNCQNHDTKQARFKTLLEDDQLFYCQKCAISLASQGFTVIKIDEDSIIIKQTKQNISSSNSKAEVSKRVQLQFFLDHVQFIKESLQKQTQLINNNKKSREKQFEKIKSQLETYFGQLFKLLNDQKDIYLNFIQKQKLIYFANNRKEDQELLIGLRNIQIVKVQIQNLIYNAQINENQYLQKITECKQKLKGFKQLVHEGNNALLTGRNYQIQKLDINSLQKVGNSMKKMIETGLKGYENKKLFSFQKIGNEQLHFQQVKIFNASNL